MKLIKIFGKMKGHIVIGIVFMLAVTSISSSLMKIYATSAQDQKICVPIIMYHQVKAKGLGKDVISPSEFESDLKYLSENNYHTITMSQLVDYVYYEKALPDNPIILTFDDGYLSTYVNVFPLLKEYNMTIVMSVIGLGTDKFSAVNDEDIEYSHMNWNELNEMKESGVIEIQNHTYNLHNTCNGRIGCLQKPDESLEDYEQILSDDILKCQDQIIKMTGSVPNTFTYPYGEFSQNSEMIVKKLGFKATLSCKYGVNIISKNPDKLYGLKRICRAHNQGVKKLIKDGLETLKYIKEE